MEKGLKTKMHKLLELQLTRPKLNAPPLLQRPSRGRIFSNGLKTPMWRLIKNVTCSNAQWIYPLENYLN